MKHYIGAIDTALMYRFVIEAVSLEKVENETPWNFNLS